MTSVPLILAEEDIEGGGKERNEGIENDFMYNNNVHNANINIRMGFLRKVYGLLSIQLMLTVTIAAVFMTSNSIKLYVQTNPWTMIVAFVMTMVFLITLLFKKNEHPTNLLLLSAFTIAEAYTVGVIVSMYETSIVLEALFITLTVVIGLTAYTFQSKRDYTFLGFGLFAGLWILLIGGVIQLFFHSTVLEMCLSIAGALIFCLFIIFDTHMIMKTLSPEEYIIATINLYLDIINLFLYILRAIAISKS
ncbi:protein lifeguard 4-like [Prorops nasuta]|uniref:protein lifeguard 4-like n=1 Tax=Prorops nasuta TaxID=863751 RepID=UPI0034CF0256